MAQSCEVAYGGMGATGFLYESMKDQLKWHRLRAKKHIENISIIGRYLVMDEEAFRKANTEKQTTEDLAAMLIAAFGDGT